MSFKKTQQQKSSVQFELLLEKNKLEKEKLKKKINQLDVEVSEYAKALHDDPSTYSIDPNGQLKTFAINDDLILHHLSAQAKEIYNFRIKNTVLEYYEGKIQSIKDNDVRRFTACMQYFQYTVEYKKSEREAYNLTRDIVNMAKAFNYLVEEGYVDFGILAPISRMKIQAIDSTRTWYVNEDNTRSIFPINSINSTVFSNPTEFNNLRKACEEKLDDEDIIEREVLFMFICPSKFITNKIYGKKMSDTWPEVMNKVTGLPYFCQEGQLNMENDWSALEKALKKNE